MTNPATPFLLGAGALALVVGTKKKKTRPRFGIRVTQDCTVEIIDQDKYKTFLRGAYLDEIGDSPGAGPFQIADALFVDVAPLCHHYPADPETMDIYRLYVNILGHVSHFLVDDGRMKPNQILELREDAEYVDWQRRTVDRLSRMWGAIPEDQVGFAKDYSEYKIGVNWEKETLWPIVAKGRESKLGLTDEQIFDAFVKQRRVLVGEHTFVRIADLPANEPAVKEFLDRIFTSIGEAG